MTQAEFERLAEEAIREDRERQVAYCWRRERRYWWGFGFDVGMAIFDGLCAAFVHESALGKSFMAAACLIMLLVAVLDVLRAVSWRRARLAALEGGA